MGGGSRDIDPLFPLTSTLDGGGCSTPAPGRFTLWKDTVSIIEEVRGAPGLGWTGAKNIAPTGIRSLDRLARSESLYRLSYSGQLLTSYVDSNVFILSLDAAANTFPTTLRRTLERLMHY